MQNVFVYRMKPRAYYLEGLGVVEVKPDGFEFRDGTYIIEPADDLIAAHPAFYEPRRIEITEKEMRDLHKAAHDHCFLAHGLDPTYGLHGFLDKTTTSYKKRLDEAYKRFAPLARALHDNISKQLNCRPYRFLLTTPKRNKHRSVC